jgi:hypothetical protein
MAKTLTTTPHHRTPICSLRKTPRVHRHKFVSARGGASYWLWILQMKKTFSFSAPDRDSARVIDGIKHDVRKYVKRERHKDLPEGADFWDFACKVGPTPDTADSKRISEVNAAIDAVASAGGAEVYIEIIAVSGKHVRHPAAPLTPAGASATAELAPPASDPAL